MKSEIKAVGTTATAICSGAGLVNQEVTILNPTGSGATVFVGGTDVTTANGFPIAEGGVMQLSVQNDTLYGIVAAGSVNLNTLRKYV